MAGLTDRDRAAAARLTHRPRRGYKIPAMAAEKTLELAVITPEQKVLETRVESAVIPAHDGELGILYNRAPLMCELGIGQLRYRSGGQVHRVFIDGGFAQVFRNRVTVLSDRALTAEQLTDETVEQFAREAQDAGLPPQARARAARRLAAVRSLRGR